MFSHLIPITTMWTGWGFNLANKCLVGSRGSESVESQLVDCSLCLSQNSRRYPWAELTTTAFQIPVSSSSWSDIVSLTIMCINSSVLWRSWFDHGTGWPKLKYPHSKFGKNYPNPLIMCISVICFFISAVNFILIFWTIAKILLIYCRGILIWATL